MNLSELKALPPAKPSSGGVLNLSQLKALKPPPTNEELRLKLYSGTINTLADLQIDPLSFKANPLKAVESGYESIKGSIEGGAQSIANAIAVFTSQGRTTSEKVGKVLEAGAGIVGAFFSPITALFSAAKQVPVLGSATRLVELPFVMAGETFKNISDKIVDNLPISQQEKDQIKPGLGEVFALASQLAVGKAGEIGSKKIADLVKTYGKEDTATIVNKAHELAQERKTTQETAPQAPTPTTEAPITPELAPKQPITEAIQPKEGIVTPEVVSIPQTTISSDPLSKKAVKYKSAEEFSNNVGSIRDNYNWKYLDEMRASKKAGYSYSHSDFNNLSKLESKLRGKESRTFYRAGDVRPDERGNIWLTPQESGATQYANAGGTKVGEYKVAVKKPLILNDLKDIEKVLGKKLDSNQYFANNPDLKDMVIKYAKKNGYDSAMFPDSFPDGGSGMESLVVWDKNLIKTKSQLISIWEKANTPEVAPTETVKVSKAQLPIGEGKEKVSRLEARLKEKLNALTPEEQAGISTYKEMNKAEQIKKAVEYVSKNPEEAIEVLEGKKPVPKGLLYNSIFLAMEELGLADSALALKLASLRSTRAGQEISILTERDPLSPVKYMTDLMARKIEAIGGKEELVRLRNEGIKEVKKSIKKSNLTKTDWSEFISSISC